MVAVPRDTHQATRHPTVVLEARSLETGAEALILTTPLDIVADPQFLHLAAGWMFASWLEELRPDPTGRLRDRYGV